MSLALFKRFCGFFAQNSYGREEIGLDLHLRARFDSLWITVALISSTMTGCLGL